MANEQLDLVVRGGRVVTGGTEAVTDVGVRDGRIAQLGGAMSGREEIDATDRWVFPGGIDAHVHLTPPGTEPGSWRWVDDFEVGTRAAAAGGITTVGNMSFPRRGEQMREGLARDVADAEANAIVDWFQHAVLLTPDDEGVRQVRELAAEGHPSIKIFLSFHRFDRHVTGYLQAMQAAADAGSVVLVHCEDPAIMHCCGHALTEAGHTEAHHYPASRPVEAERIATDHNRMIVLLKVRPDNPLQAPEVAPESETRVGQWAIAVGRTPVNSMSMSSSGRSPERWIRSRARSTIFTGSPMSRMNTSPPLPIVPACSTSCEASGMVMK